MRVGERQPHVVIAAGSNSGESRLGYADNREWDVVQFYGAPDGIARAAEGALPVAVIQDSYGRRGRRIVARPQDAAHRGFDAHRAEKATGNYLAIYHAGGAIAAQVEPAGVGKRSDARESTRLFYFVKHRFGEGTA